MTTIPPAGLANAATARRSPDEWRVLMHAFSRSDETRKQFCERHGVKLTAFAWWRRRLGQPSPAGASRSSSPSPTPANTLFVELAEEVKPVTAAVPTWDVELELGGSVFLRLRRAAC